MDLHQLKTFVTVAREGSITRSAELLHLSQPAVSAHIKALEDALGLALFERIPRGMSLTAEGKRLLAKAEGALAAHRDLMDEATRLKGRVAGPFRLGAGSNSSPEVVGRFVTALAEQCPEVEVIVKHGTSVEILAGIRGGGLDAGLYNEAGETAAELAAIEVSRFRIFVVGPPGATRDWRALAEQPWIYPPSSACCGRTAELLFRTHGFRPQRIVSVDREVVTRTLIAGGIGVGLLHADTAHEAAARGEVALLHESPTDVRVLYAQLASRAQDPLLATAAAIMRAAREPTAPAR